MPNVLPAWLDYLRLPRAYKSGKDTSSAPTRARIVAGGRKPRGNRAEGKMERGRQETGRLGSWNNREKEREGGEDEERKARGVTNKYTKRYTRRARESPSFRVSL